ncbi:hypothetical protein PM082_021501 [Marasmius tenuissimus]|nr:hypothetical protein PM082_021501 [Marasmius tenuissimus]
MSTEHSNALFDSPEPQPAPPSTHSLPAIVKSNLGTSLVALAVVPMLAIATYLLRKLKRRPKGSSKKSRGAIFENCTPVLDSKPRSPILYQYSLDRGTDPLARPEIAHSSPRPPVVNEVERYTTAPSSPRSAHAYPHLSKHTSQYLQEVQESYLQCYRVSDVKTHTVDSKSPISPASPCTPGSLSPAPLPFPETPLIKHPMNCSGQLLYNIPWIHERLTHPGINTLVHPQLASPPIRSEESHADLASSPSPNLTTAEIRLKSSASSFGSRHFGVTVDDRYPVSLSKSYLSLSIYTKSSHYDLASIQEDLDDEEEEGKASSEEDFLPTASSCRTSEPELYLNEYYSFADDDETATTRTVQDIIEDDRKNFMGLSDRILQARTNNQTCYDPTVPRWDKLPKIQNNRESSTMRLLNEFPAVPPPPPPPSDPLPEPPRSTRIVLAAGHENYRFEAPATLYPFSQGQNAVGATGEPNLRFGVGRVGDRPRREKISWDLSKENVPF